MMKLNTGRMSRSDLIAAGTGLLAFIAIFLPWYGLSSAFGGVSVSGWGTGYGWLGALLIVAAAGYRTATRVTEMPRRRLSPALLVLGLSVLGTILLLIRIGSLPNGNISALTQQIAHYGPMAGIVLALVTGVIESVLGFGMYRAAVRSNRQAGAVDEGPPEARLP